MSNEAETAEAEFSDSKELNEAANWLQVASKGRLEEFGVEGGDEKSRLEDMGDEEDVVLLPFELVWKLLLPLGGEEPMNRSSESRLRSKMLVKLSSETCNGKILNDIVSMKAGASKINFMTKEVL